MRKNDFFYNKIEEALYTCPPYSEHSYIPLRFGYTNHIFYMKFNSDEKLLQELEHWQEEKNKLDFKPFLGVVPTWIKYRANLNNDFEVEFTFEDFDKDWSPSWKEWFILPEDKRKMIKELKEN